MSDSFGTFLKGYSQRDRGELDNPLSPSRLILAAVQEAAKTNKTKTDKELMEDIGLREMEFRSALQLLADAKLVTVRPEKGTLVVEIAHAG
jgi:hypothetical protein